MSRCEENSSIASATEAKPSRGEALDSLSRFADSADALHAWEMPASRFVTYLLERPLGFLKDSL